MTDDEKKWIDEQEYETLLRLWRSAPIDDPRFTGEHGRYFRRVMMEKRDADPDAAVRASKNVG